MTMHRFARVASRLFNVPLMIRQDKAEMLVAALADRLGIARLDFADSNRVLMIDELQQMAAIGTDGNRAPHKVYDLCDGVALIPIEGTLVHKLGSVDPWSGMTGYDGLAYKLRAAMDDSEVSAIMLDIDSPGGEVSGCFDFCDELASYTARMGGKPIWAFVNEAAYSAAYAIASQCDKIVLPRTGGVGSIGVLTMHVDMSAAMAKGGINATLIFSGEHKVDGNPYEALPKAVRSTIQTSLDNTRFLFAETVARGRRMSVDDILATEAACFDGADAVSAGLADSVASEIETFAALLSLT
jgi:signal peptide peptidase SppA